MRIYTYVVRYDFGFAPNPFYGHCTLATCQAPIRRTAQIGDWVIGTGAKTSNKLSGRLVYAMCVSETLTYDQYWNDPRFRTKRPVVGGSLKQMYGDNIYHRADGRWVQADSRHSRPGGRKHADNAKSDLRADRVLIADRFA